MARVRPSHASHNSRDSRIKMSAGGGDYLTYLEKRRKKGERGGKLNVDVYGGSNISAKKPVTALVTR